MASNRHRRRGKSKAHNPGKVVVDLSAHAEHLCFDMTVKPGLREDCCIEEWNTYDPDQHVPIRREESS